MRCVVRSVKGWRSLVAGASSLAVVLAAAQMPTYAGPMLSVSAKASAKDDLAAQLAALDSDGDGVPDRPDKTSAMLAAQQLDRRIEDLSQRTPTTQVFANGKGTWTTKIAAAPVRAQDPDSGEWRAIDTSLVESEDGWRPVAALGAMIFSDGGTGPLVTMTDADGKDFSWTWPTRLPMPSAAGSTLTYSDVVPNGDLVVTATPTGFSESVILRSAPTEALSLPLLIDTNGAKMSKLADGSFSVRGKKVSLLSVPIPMMWEAADTKDLKKGATGRGPARPIPTTLTPKGDRTELVLKPDPGYLSDPSTTYPVTIDPSFNVYPTSMTVVPDVDYAWGWAPVEAWTGLDAGWDWNYHTFLDFGPAQLKAGGITSATLALYGTFSESCDPSAVTIRRITSDWSDFGQWNDRPTSTSNGEATAANPAHSGPSGCSAGGWDTWDITSITQAWASGAPNYGIEMFDEAGAPFKTYNGPTLHAPGGPPTISVTSNGTPGVPDVPTASDSQTWNGNLYTRSASPSFSTRADDADQGLLHYTFDVHETATDTSPIISSCSTRDVASGTTSSCKPTTPLANGTYYVRASASDGSLTGDRSPWQKVIVNYDQPDQATVACTNSIANGAWFTTRPASTGNCTFTSVGAVQLAWTLNGVHQTTLVANASGRATTTISIPTAGWTDIEVRGISNAGTAGTPRSLKFGVGSAWIITPKTGGASAGSFTIRASTVGAPTTSTSNAVKGKDYRVYAIRYFKPNDAHGYIWKYGITGGVSDKRPQSQISKCTREMKSVISCTWEFRAWDLSKWQAMALEATLIGNYLKAYHRCPPGHNPGVIMRCT